MSEICKAYSLFRCLPPNDNEDEQRLYLIKSKKLGLYKIGRSNNPHRRLSECISHGLLDAVLVLSAWPCCDYNSAKKVEMFLHSFFKHKRIKNEFFSLSKADVLKIKKLLYEEEIEFIYYE